MRTTVTFAIRRRPVEDGADGQVNADSRSPAYDVGPRRTLVKSSLVITDVVRRKTVVRPADLCHRSARPTTRSWGGFCFDRIDCGIAFPGRDEVRNPAKTKSMSALLILFVVLTVGLLPACQKTTDQEDSSSPSEPGTFRVAMLLPGSVDDQSFNTSGYNGLMLIKEELGASVAYAENVVEPAMETLFRQYAQEGYDLVIGLGAQFRASIEKVAGEFPRTNFMLLGYYAGNNSNLGAVSFWQGEIGYLAGSVAGLKTATNKVAFVTGFLYPHQEEKALLLQRGAEHINPAVEVRIVALETWEDQEIARTTAQALIDGGFDVIAVDADSAGLPIHDMAQEAGIHTIGWTFDQHELAPEAILTSALQRPELVLLAGARIARLGQWEGKQYKFGIRAGVQDLAPFRGALTPEEEERIDEVRESLLRGDVGLLSD